MKRPELDVAFSWLSYRCRTRFVALARGREGWQFKQLVLPASENFGKTESMIAIFERAIE